MFNELYTHDAKDDILKKLNAPIIGRVTEKAEEFLADKLAFADKMSASEMAIFPLVVYASYALAAKTAPIPIKAALLREYNAVRIILSELERESHLQGDGPSRDKVANVLWLKEYGSRTSITNALDTWLAYARLCLELKASELQNEAIVQNIADNAAKGEAAKQTLTNF